MRYTNDCKHSLVIAKVGLHVSSFEPRLYLSYDFELCDCVIIIIHKVSKTFS